MQTLALESDALTTRPAPPPHTHTQSELKSRPRNQNQLLEVGRYIDKRKNSKNLYLRNKNFNMIWLPVRVEVWGWVTRLCYLLPDDAGVRLEFYNLFLYTGFLKCIPIHVHNTHKCTYVWIEPNQWKTCHRSFRPVRIQTALNHHRRWQEACSFVFRKKGDCTVALITNSRLSHDTAQLMA